MGILDNTLFNVYRHTWIIYIFEHTLLRYRGKITLNFREYLGAILLGSGTFVFFFYILFERKANMPNRNLQNSTEFAFGYLL